MSLSLNAMGWSVVCDDQLILTYFSMAIFQVCKHTNDNINHHIFVITSSVDSTCTNNPVLYIYSKTCLKRSLNKDQKLAFNTDYCLMQVKGIAECSVGVFCNTFHLH